MSLAQDAVLERLSGRPASPALRRIREMALDPTVEVGRHAPVQSAHELLSIWSIRLWNATLRAHRIIGLADLVRCLMKLQPEEKVEQMALKQAAKTGLVFFAVESGRPIGAVISVQTEPDVQRSSKNLEQAQGVRFPVLSSKSSMQ